MFLSILIILKTILYMNITRVEYNKLIILLFTSLLSIIILSGVEFSRMKSRGKKTIQIIFYLLFSTIAFVDIMYYSYFQSLPSVALLGQAGQLGAVKDIILIILSIKNLLMIIDLPFVIYYIIKKQGERDLTPLVKTRFLFGLVSLFALVNIVAISEEKIPALKSQELFSYHTGDIINYYFKEVTNSYYKSIKM